MSAIRALSHAYVRFSPRSVARSLSSCALSDVLDFLGKLASAERTQLFPYLHSYVVSSFLLKHLIDAPDFLEELSDIHAAAAISCIAEAERLPLLSALGEERRAAIERITSFIPGTAGSIMDASIAPVRQEETIQSCATSISSGGRYFYYIYVVDDKSHLVGVTTMRRVFEMKSSNDSIRSIMDENVQAVGIDHTAAEILKNPGWEAHHSMPVVGHDGEFLGVILYSALKTLQRKNSKDRESESVALTASELGELYSLGFSAFLGGTGSVTKSTSGHD